MYVYCFITAISKSPKTPAKFSENKMNCELILTYDTPAYMFNVHKNHQ